MSSLTRSVVVALALSGALLLPSCLGPSDGGGGGGRGGSGGGGPCTTTAVDGGSGCARSRTILACDVTNARDLGGVPLGTSGAVACGQLFRGPPLALLSVPGCDDVTRLGIRTVIDLRVEDERRANPAAACVQANVVLAPLPVPVDVSPENYLGDFDSRDSIARVFRTLADSAAYPVYVHCTYGRDRTGVVIAAVLLALGASRDDVMLEYGLSAATVGAFPASLAALIDEIERRGGIEAALAAAGVTASDLAALRARLAVPPI